MTYAKALLTLFAVRLHTISKYKVDREIQPETSNRMLSLMIN